MSNITLYTSNADKIKSRLIHENYTITQMSGNCLTITKSTGDMSYTELSHILAKESEQLMIIYETSELLKEMSLSGKSLQAITKNISFSLDKASIYKIAQEIEEIIRQGSELNLDGYIIFHMKSERAATGKALMAAIKDMLIKYEYEQFIKNLSEYVESSAQQEAELHIIPHKGRYKLLNSQKADLTASSFAAYLAEVSPGEINYDDWLVGALLDILPAKIIIHHNKKISNKNIITTIANIFKGKVSFC